MKTVFINCSPKKNFCASAYFLFLQRLFTGGEKVISHTKAVEMLHDGDRQQIVNVTLAPSYQISGGGNAEDIRAILEEHDRQLPDKVTSILREAERDAVRRSYS